MPTALDVVADEATTPPKTATTMKEESCRKITPSATAEKPKKKKAQPSIVSFFKQPSSKNLFTKTKSPTTSAAASPNKSTSLVAKSAPPTIGKDAVATSSKDDSAAAAAAAAVATKPAAKATTKKTKATSPPASTLTKFSSKKPTKAELMEIVLGSASKQNFEVIVTEEPIVLSSEAESSVLPDFIMPIPCLKKKVVEDTAPSAAAVAFENAQSTSAQEQEPSVQVDSPAAKAVAEKTSLVADASEGKEGTNNVNVQVGNDDLATPVAPEIAARAHETTTLGPEDLAKAAPNGVKAGSKTSGNIEMSRDDLTTFCEFVHHCSIPSKGKLIKEVRTVHKTITSSYAQAMRKLDAISEKKKNPNGGVYWEVKEDVLKELGLEDLLKKKIEAPTNPPTKSQGAKESNPTKFGTPETNASPDSEDLTHDDAVTSAPMEHKTATQDSSAMPPAVSNKTQSAKLNEAVPAAAPVISAERRAVLAKHDAFRLQCNARLEELVNKARHGLEEEDFQLPAPTPSAQNGEVSPSSIEFPDFAIPSLAVVIQGSNLPLSDLVDTALIQIRKAFPNVEFHAESVASKIKLLATRESYVHSLESQLVNSFEDINAGRMWRWEIISLDLLSDDCTTKVKKARAARKKVRSHSKALCDLLKALNQAKTLLQDAGSSQTKCDEISTKISNAEEKVLRFEREAEKARIAEEANKKKEAEKAKKEQEKQMEKCKAQEAQELKKREIQSKKAELKRQKEEEKQKDQEEKDRKLKKQRTIMQSFFSHQFPDAKQTKPAKPATPASLAAAVDTEKFWSCLNAADHHVPLFPKLTPRAVASRARRTRKVPVQVYETVIPDGYTFGAQPYAEPKTIRVANKYKYLSFYEDCRPPYHGTWTKGKSPLVTGKNPFGQDTKHLDYDVDSEGEWEEGDCEVGEDVEDEGADDEEEDMDREDADDQDGFICSDDDMGSDDEEIDEETKLLRKKKLEARNLQAINSNLQKKTIVDQGAVYVIAPRAGGIPADKCLNKLPEGTEIIEGVSPREAFDLLSSHTGRILVSEDPCLDAFPPLLIEEGNLDVPVPSTGIDDMSHEDLIAFVEFVHHSSLPSKDRLVEELRTAHKTITSSRARATRKLHSIAEKKRHPNGGVYWEVKRDVLEELGLEELLKKEFEVPTNPSSEDEMSRDDLIAFVEFVHHCTLPSKDKLIEELRTVHKTVTSSRAQATRKLDSIAEKKRNPNGGVYWEVRRDILEELGLKELLQKQVEVLTNPPSDTKVPLAPSATNGTTPVQSKSDAPKNNEESKSDAAFNSDRGSKKRALPDVSASAKLFARFLKKKAKTETK